MGNNVLLLFVRFLLKLMESHSLCIFIIFNYVVLPIFDIFTKSSSYLWLSLTYVHVSNTMGVYQWTLLLCLGRQCGSFCCILTTTPMRYS